MATPYSGPVLAEPPATKRPYTGPVLPQPLRAAGEFVNDAVNKAGTGITRGLSYIPGMPSDLSKLALGANEFVEDKLGLKALDNPISKTARGVLQSVAALPGSSDIKNYIFNDLGVPEVNATSKPGRIAQGAAEGVGAAAPMLFGNAAPVVTTVYGALSGAGAQAARELNIDPVAHPVLAKLAPILGAVLPPAVFAGVRTLFPSMPSIAKDAVKNNAPLLDDAAETQRLGNAQGVPVTGPEAIGDPTLLRIQSMAEQHPKGAPLRTIMDVRPDAQRAAVARQTETLGDMTPSQSAATTAQAAKDTVSAAEKARTTASKPYYEAAALETMPVRRIDPLLNEIDDALLRVGEGSDIGKKLLEYKGKIQSAVKPGGQFGPEVGVGPLNAIFKETRDGIGKTKLEPGALDKEVKGILGPLNTKLGLMLRVGNENIMTGSAAYQAASPAVNELKKGQVGALVPKKGVPPTIDRQANVLLDPNNARPDEVAKTLRAINATDPEAVPNFIKSYVDNAMDAASKRTQAGPQQNVGGKFYSNIAGTPNAKANLRAAYGTLPDGTDRWQAFENTLRVFEANARRMPVGSPTFEKGAIEGALSGGTSVQPMNTFNNWVTRMRYGRNVGQLAELFARSDSVDEMRRLAGLAANDPQARIAVGTFLNASQGAGGQK